MANRTDKAAVDIHGTNPQFLVEKIIRERIYASMFWKEECFALTAATIIDKVRRGGWRLALAAGARSCRGATPVLCARAGLWFCVC
jgi:hypothetical protein